MDNTKKYDNPSPENGSSTISKIFFWWLLPFVKYSYQKNIGTQDVFSTTEADTSKDLTDILERHWTDEINNRKGNPKLLVAIRKTFLTSYTKIGILVLLRALLSTYSVPALLAGLVDSFSEVPQNKMKALYLGCALVFVNFTNSVLWHHSSLMTSRIGMRVRIACSSLMYRKVLRLNKTSLDDTNVGQLVNLLSNDVNRFDLAAQYSHYIWVMPIQAMIGIWIMYRTIGISTLPGMATMIIQALLFQGTFSKLQGKWRLEIAQKTDGRVKLMAEIINGIQVIKMYTWEKPFEKCVALLRKYEIHSIKKTSYIKALSAAIAVYTERLTVYIVVITYVLLGKSLSGAVVFSMFQIINSLQLYISILFPMGLSTYSEAKTSVHRIEKFLKKSEREDYSDNKTLLSLSGNDCSVKLDNVHARWTPNPAVDTLIDVSLHLKPGTFCCIFGAVGSGKSSLVHVMLNELPVSMGKIQIGGTVSYASQIPWLFTSSVRNNILFGKPYNKEKYEKTVEVCSLQRDFNLLPYGDKTNVGERGVSLSGGQRARINLARAVYTDADIYLFDDPLSAVDPEVAEHLFDKCFLNYLQSKTRILVTHQVQFLNRADFVLLLNNGKVEKFINSTELSTNELEIMKQEAVPDKTSHVPNRKESKISSKPCEIEDAENVQEEPQETEELIEKGTMSASVYRKYFKAGDKTFLLILYVFVFVIAQIICNATDLWVTFWTNNIEKKNMETISLYNITIHSTKNFSETKSTNGLWSNYYVYNDSPNVIEIIKKAFINGRYDYLTTTLYIQIYTLLIILTVILTTARTILVYKVCLNASRNLHDSMFRGILRATMRFFDTNPSGRILNRFSKDIGTIDEVLPTSILSAMQATSISVGIIGIAIVKSIWFLPLSIAVGYMLYWVQKVFMRGIQDLKRLEAITKAPIFSHVAASLDGLSTIRSANAQEMVRNEFDIIQDQHTASWFLYTVSYEAFGFYMELVSVVYLLMAVILFLLNEHKFGGDVGLVISQSLIVMLMAQFTVRYYTEVASTMTNVERVLQYTKLDEEGEIQSLTGRHISTKWPQTGRISFKNVNLRYATDEEPVLKNLNINIENNEKIGVVGRTGAGKSSLISAMFRLALIEGIIEIDGVDVSAVGLETLRSKISIIPQEPTLFSETVRYNLDPFGIYNDQLLWQALESVELKNSIENLDMKISEGGSNFSAGQRQLLCLARAILRNNRILVLDEATANIDTETDALIQNSIRKHFKNCTVITVAHRLNTIMDSDKVLVIDAGEIKEFAPPHELLQNRDGYFSKMLSTTGKQMENQLREIAKNHYKLREQFEQNYLSK
ncbi:hypothetical protein WA026_000961 [Henosepilachna vigintioctopunctata]|uniref:Uncharacterized protein n=1 Tax=Henosepilachna vigintioctopunctata TaxID=420089 RepID=A0AAW1V5I9_9CUCU